MDVQSMNVDKEEAHKLWKKYQSHRAHHTAEDAEIARIYKAIANGKLIIPALAEIVRTGLNEAKLPKLAIGRADEKVVYLSTQSNGSATMSGTAWVNGNTARARVFQFKEGSFPGIATQRHRMEAMMPLIPVDIRPKRGLQNYHVLWEVDEWERSKVPVDPLLLRRHGEDTWVVLGAWDLTQVERSVMARFRRPK